ncbi:serine racemase [Hysterangium stoloniferum]|nr:serine racemase [Hysterangium stoloniferum]
MASKSQHEKKPVVSISDVLQAAEEIKPFIHPSSDGLSLRLVMKCENLQKVGAFKIRGATNAIRSLLRECPASNLTVVTHSSGNHAQALALAARQLGVRAHVIMPITSSFVKKAAVRGYGADVTECAPTLQAREDTAAQVIKMESSKDPARKVEFVPPYDDVRIIAGQGTIAVEFLEQARMMDRPLDVIIAPVGGGGMLSGVALATKSLGPNVWVVGAEPAGADDAYRSFTSKKFQPSIEPKTVADGLLTSTGEITFPLILEYVDAIYTVTEEQIIGAMKFVFERMKFVIEPSAAVPLAVALFSQDFKKSLKHMFSCQSDRLLNVGIVFSGGNVDLSIVSKLFDQV